MLINNLPIIHSYHTCILGSDIFRADNTVIGLGFKLDNSLNPGPYIEMVSVARLQKCLAFINSIFIR